MSKRSKVHHYVPQVLQKFFASEDDYKRIWYSKRAPNGVYEAPELKKFEKVFYKRNYYSVMGAERPSDIIEKKFYGEIDDYLGKFLPQVLDALNAGEIPKFSASVLSSLRECVFQMVKRTPEFTKEYDDLSLGRELADQVLAETKNQAEIDKFKLISENPHRLREYGRDIRVRGTLNNSERVRSALQELTVRWAKSESKHSFILSSMITYRIGNGGKNGLANPNMEIWMPISPKYCLVLLRDSENKVPYIVSEGRDHIREINTFAAKESQEIASHSRELIESITGKLAKTI